MVKGEKNTIKHIDYALVPKTHPPMYSMHKYWARKPHNVVAEYIKHYSNEGEIVLDPFCGSGVTAIEAIKLGRKAIAIDLNPVSVFITKCTTMPVDLKKFEVSFRKIEEEINPLAEELYETSCPKCNSKAVIIGMAYDNGNPFEMVYECPKCGKKRGKITDFDIKKMKKIEEIKIKEWYPTTKMYYNGNSFLKKEKKDSVDQLFSKRNLIILSKILSLIEKTDDNKIRDMLKFVFSSTLPQASKMMPYIKESVGKICKGWTVHSYWVPTQHWELNVLIYFRLRFNEILRGKKESNQLIKNYKEAKKFSDFNDGANIIIKTHNALELTEVVTPNSIDYVFTDPPYGGSIQYFELSTLWASWLKMDLDYNDEITVNLHQKKDFGYYHKMLRASFKEIYQVLKPGKYMTVTFHSTDIKVWNSIIKAVVMVGFKLEKIIYQPPPMPSAKGQLQPYGSAVGDYYIRFMKPEKEALETEKEIDLKTYELEVVDAAQRIIGERGEPTIYQHILNGIMAELQGGRRVPVGAKNIEEVLEEHIEKEFEVINIKDDKGKTIGKKWWLKGADISHFSQPTLSDRVERKIVEVLEHNIKVSFDEILQAIFIEFPNALTPETEKIKDVLKEYAVTSDGKWKLRPEIRLNLTESAHSKMIYMLALLGEKAGFDVWVGQKEQSQEYNKTKLNSLVTIKKPVWRFVNTFNWDRVNQIDVVWHDRGRIAFEFEVENTTAITEAISRGSNIPPNNLRRVIVIPKERENLLYRKMKDPMINENIVKQDWRFIFYQDLENFFNKKHKKFSLSDFEKLFKLPKETKEVQKSLKLYL
ncbi:MAG: DNA methyltransferase [Candidatus Diapherotrites archaeon]